MEFLYRFRSMDALIGEHAELQNQEIYFASPAQLNDPMEGFKDIFWKGDEIVWRNLFKHYILCLMETTSVVLLLGKEYKPDIIGSIVFQSESTLPPAPIRDIVKKIYQKCFENDGVNELIAYLAAQKHLIRREEILFFIRLFNGTVFPIILSILHQHDLAPPLKTPPDGIKMPDVKGIISLFTKLAEMPDALDKGLLAGLFVASDRVNQQMQLINFMGQPEESRSGWWSLCTEFPEQYIARLTNIIYTDWYAACFVSSPDQAAMWGNYADGHKGCCLKFRVKKNNRDFAYLSLHRVTGRAFGPKGNQPIFGDAEHLFYPIRYVNKFVEVDFFRSLGRISVAALQKDWYSDESGITSKCADGIFSNESEWRSKYWENFESTITTKLEDWQHENEYRLILHSFDDWKEESKRKIKYNLFDLEGIIFGIATSLEDKRRILNIVEQVCKAQGRKEFEFSQAYYSAHSGKIEVHPLSLLKFE